MQNYQLSPSENSQNHPFYPMYSTPPNNFTLNSQNYSPSSIENSKHPLFYPMHPLPFLGLQRYPW